MAKPQHEREAPYWRAEALRQRERADTLSRALERKTRLLRSLIDYFKGQVAEGAPDDTGNGGQG